MVEYLDKVKSLYNTDTYTVVEIETNKNRYTFKLPYTEIVLEKHRGTGVKYNYSLGVKQWCKLHGISTKEYFKILHKDVE